MKNIKKKIFAALLSAAMLISFASCNNSNDTNDNNKGSTTTTTANSAGETPSEETTEPIKEVIKADIPDDFSFDGYKFRVVYNPKADVSDWGIEFAPEEETAEAVNDETYRRNQSLMEKYNFEIVPTRKTFDSLSTGFIKKSVNSGQDDYDLVIMRQNPAAGAIASNAFLDLTKFPYLDFTKPYWDSQIINNMSINNKHFAVFGDMIYQANDALKVMFFNKSLITQNSLENPHELVSSGKWTLDKLYDLSKDISQDLNGDGKFDKDDRFGLSIFGGNQNISFGSGEVVTSKDENDKPIITANQDRSMLVFDKVSEILHAPNLIQTYGGYTEVQAAFEAEKLLFFVEVLSLAERMRMTTTDFGIIPFPKLDEAQEKYYAFGDNWCSIHMFVPTTNTHQEYTGAFMELMNAASHDTVRTAYYDKNLNGKFTRDEESGAMLDIIFANKITSLDEMYGWGMFSALGAEFGKKTPSFVSMLEKNEIKVQSAIDKTIEAISAME